MLENSLKLRGEGGCVVVGRKAATREVAQPLFSALSRQLSEDGFKRQGSAARFIRNGGEGRSERISIQLARYDDRIEIVPAFGIRFDDLEDLLDTIDEDREKAETRHKTTASKTLSQLDGKWNEQKIVIRGDRDIEKAVKRIAACAKRPAAEFFSRVSTLEDLEAGLSNPAESLIPSRLSTLIYSVGIALLVHPDADIQETGERLRKQLDGKPEQRLFDAFMQKVADAKARRRLGQ